MADITEYLQKKVPDSELKFADLNDMFIKANKDNKNDEKVAILTGNEIYEFFEIAWKKLEEIKKAEEGYDLAAKQYHAVGDEIYDLKYDKSKLDTTKYVDLG